MDLIVWPDPIPSPNECSDKPVHKRQERRGEEEEKRHSENMPRGNTSECSDKQMQ